MGFIYQERRQMSQVNKVCPYCNELGHSGFYCPNKPRKEIKRSPIKQNTDIIRAKGRIKRPRKKTVTRSHLVKKLDSVFSQYIRQKYAVDGMTACVTCGVVKRWQEQQNGHYESRGHLPTRWSEDNCAPQCVACNVFKKGNYTEYAIWMLNTYGADKLVELKQRANSSIKITSVELKEMIEKYTNLLT